MTASLVGRRVHVEFDAEYTSTAQAGWVEVEDQYTPQSRAIMLPAGATITEVAPEEPTGRFAVIEVTDEDGDVYTFVRFGAKTWRPWLDEDGNSSSYAYIAEFGTVVVRSLGEGA